MRKAMRTAAGLLAALALTLVVRGAGAEQPPPLDAPAGIYVVRPGDNLWTLSGQFLHNPFLWPRIWERNKFVTNAHRIYPGDPLLIPGYVPPPPEGVALPGAPVAPAEPVPAPGGVPEPVAAVPAAPGTTVGAAPGTMVGAPPGAEPAPTIITPPPAVLRVVTRTQYICLGFIHGGGPWGSGTSCVRCGTA